jgi:hypothetical protein
MRVCNLARYPKRFTSPSPLFYHSNKAQSTLFLGDIGILHLACQELAGAPRTPFVGYVAENGMRGQENENFHIAAGSTLAEAGAL